jgi:hypothetical protein
MQVNLTPSGDARWTVTSRFSVENESPRVAFEAMVDDVRNGTPPAGTVGYSAATFRSLAERVGGSIDRSTDMAIERAEWSGVVNNETARLSLSFTWTNFAETVPPNRVVLGDVFEAEAAWFSAVGADQRLVINPPPEYAVTDYSLAQPFDDGSVFFEGPENLTALNVSITYVESEASPGTPTPGTPTPTTPTETPGGDDEGGAGLMLVGGGLLLAILLLIVAVYVRGEDPFDRLGETTAGDGGTTETGPAGGNATESPAAADPPDASGAVPAGSETAGGPEDGTEAEDDDGVDEELLSDEERVERLLERNGGRMKQANIVSETGWSNAKVSQLLSAMDDEDRIDKLRIGRENLITLPDEDVGDFE